MTWSSNRKCDFSSTGMSCSVLFVAFGPLRKGAHRLLRLVAEHREGKPVARVVHGLVPREVAPEVQLLFCVTRRLGKLRGQLLRDLVDLRVELGRRPDPVPES